MRAERLPTHPLTSQKELLLMQAERLPTHPLLAAKILVLIRHLSVDAGTTKRVVCPSKYKNKYNSVAVQTSVHIYDKYRKRCLYTRYNTGLYSTGLLQAPEEKFLKVTLLNQ